MSGSQQASDGYTIPEPCCSIPPQWGIFGWELNRAGKENKEALFAYVGFVLAYDFIRFTTSHLMEDFPDEEEVLPASSDCFSAACCQPPADCMQADYP
jgi:hypothetical protein